MQINAKKRLALVVLLSMLAGVTVSGEPLSALFEESRFMAGTGWVVLEEPVFVLLHYSLVSVLLFIFYQCSSVSVKYHEFYYTVIITYVFDWLGYMFAVGVFLFDFSAINILIIFVPYFVVLIQTLYIVSRTLSEKDVIKVLPYYISTYSVVLLSDMLFLSVYKYYVS